MTVRFVFTFALAALALGCSSDLPTAPGQRHTARNLDRSAPAVAFGGHCKTSFNAQQFEPTEAGLRIIVHGTCYLTHLGESDLYIDQTANFAAGTIAGTAVFTAANGDKLYSTFAGPLAPPVGPLQMLDVTSTFVGGTGRFAAAAGTARSTAVINLATETGELRYDGSIIY